MGPYSVGYTRGRVCDEKEEDGCEIEMQRERWSKEF